MKETEKLYNFERHTFDIVQKMVFDAGNKLGKDWKLDYKREKGSVSGRVFSTVSVIEGERIVYRSELCDNVSEACMLIVAFVAGVKAATERI